MRNNQKYRAISLFSGCGGLDLGFKMAGIDIIWAADKDFHACKTHSYNLGGNTSCIDLTNYTEDDIPDAEILILGPPCQGFSNIGKRNPKDARNYLFKDAIRIVEAKKPSVILFENVKGLKSFMNGEVLKEVINSLKVMKYHVRWQVINAKDFGVPQNRERLFIIASHHDISDFFDKVNTHKVKEALKLADAISDLEELETFNNHISNNGHMLKYDHILSRVNQGQKLCDTRLGKRSVHTWEIPEVYGVTSKEERKILNAIAKNRRKKKFRKKESWNDASPLSIEEISAIIASKIPLCTIKSLIKKGYIVEKAKGLYDLKHTFNGKFRRLSYNRPSEAVLTNFGSPRNYIHPTQNRALTVRECARIQTFPDNFIFQGPISSQYRQVGNAVPPDLAHILATEIYRVLSCGKKKSKRVFFSPHVVSEVIRQLKRYGTPRLGNLNNPLDELIYIYISQRTFEQSYQHIYKSLRKKYLSFEKLRKANKKKLIQILEPAGLARQKAEAILGSLNKIRKDFGETSLRKISNFSEEERLSYLLSLPRVGIKSAYCIMMYSFGSEVLPIDANIRRVCQRLGWLPLNINDKKEHSILHSIVPPEERYAFHVNCLMHGRNVCKPKSPRCGKCVIDNICLKLGGVE